MDTLSQLGELLLASIPTVICLLIVWGAYRTLVQKKLDKVLAERRERTEGALQQAKSEISKTEARTSEYEQRLRAARSQIYKRQEDRRRQIMERRSQALAEAQQQAEARVKQARAKLASDMKEARTMLEGQANTLAERIIHSILRPFAMSGGR